MGEGQPLLNLGVMPDCIWGDDDETAVYAQAFGQGKSIMFRFLLNLDGLQSLPTRIVSSYHRLDISNHNLSQDRSAIRNAIWSAIATVWPKCVVEPAVRKPSTVIDLTSDEFGNTAWRAYQEPLFDQYLNHLRSIQSSELMPQSHAAPIVDISQLVFLEGMGGKGCCKRVQLETDPGNFTTFAFKGIDFQTYLQTHDDDDEFVTAVVKTWRQSSKLVAQAAPHPNIQSPPNMLVSVRSPIGGDPVLIGHLSTFLANGDLGSIISSANVNGTQIPVRSMAKWCLQMSLAVAHAHRVMQTFHMDIKPGNFLLDDEQNLRLIDWEQCGAPASTLAPEADGTWEVNEEDIDGTGAIQLVYTRYTGPERRNMPEGSGQQTFNIWNVFPDWQANHPKASELAEVFALGRTMWMLLAKINDNFEEVEHPNDVQVLWKAKGIPLHWIQMVDKCMEKDPNRRPAITDLVTFWENEELILKSD